MLVFPGFIRGLLEAAVRDVDGEVQLAVADAIAAIMDDELSADHIVPDVFGERLVTTCCRRSHNSGNWVKASVRVALY